MKHTLLGLLLFAGAASAQDISFTDANLKTKLLSSTNMNYVARDVNGSPIAIDANLDGEIDQAEATAVYRLNISSASIASLGGLEYFVNLTELTSYTNELTAIDTSQFPNLTILACGGNQITSLDLAPLTGLEILSCSHNAITTLDLANMATLVEVEAFDNPLTSLTTGGLSGLERIFISETMLTEIDLSDSPLLKYFHIDDNPDLVSINIKNGGSILYPGECSITNNPSLVHICIDGPEEEAMMLEYFEGYELTPIPMGTDCDLPGTDLYNSIVGHVKFDFNNDGCDDNDSDALYLKVNLNDGALSRDRYTDGEGDYLFYAGAGTFMVTPQFENPYFAFTPPSAQASFNAMDGSVQTLDFCLTANGVHNDLEIVVVPWGAARPGFDAVYRVIYRNKGNQVLSGSVGFTYEDAVLDYVSASPAEDTSATGLLQWNFTDLMPFEFREILVTLNVNTPTEDPAVDLGDILTFNGFLVYEGTDETQDDNTFVLDQTVTNSLDPNNIVCLQGDTEDPDAIGGYLHYVVNFENIGDEAAEFVVITNEIDAAQYDINTLQVLGSSHNVATTVEGNTVTFRFDGIDLAPDAVGDVVYKVKTLSSLEEGDSVANDASIVFDFNAPLATNEAVTLFELPMSTGHFEAMTTAIYPNPVRDIVNISAETAINSVELYDLQGRLLERFGAGSTTVGIDLSGRAAGMYMLKAVTGKGVKTAKIVKE